MKYTVVTKVHPQLRIIIFVAIFIVHLTKAGVQRPHPTEPRLSLVEWGEYSVREEEGPGSYAFGYDIEDPDTNNVQTRSEERYPNGTVVGNYGYVQPDGSVLLVNYVADEKGYRANIESNPRGMLKPIKTNEKHYLRSERGASPQRSNPKTTRKSLVTKPQSLEEKRLESYQHISDLQNIVDRVGYDDNGERFQIPYSYLGAFKAFPYVFFRQPPHVPYNYDTYMPLPSKDMHLPNGYEPQFQYFQ